MDVGELLGWVGTAGIDADMRLLCGKGEVTRLNTPAYIFDKANVATAGKPATFNAAMATPISPASRSSGAFSDVKPRRDRFQRTPGDALVVERLSKRFGGALALDNVDLTVRRGGGARPSRQQRLRQIDADQDPGRVPRARTGRPRSRCSARTCRLPVPAG